MNRLRTHTQTHTFTYILTRADTTREFPCRYQAAAAPDAQLTFLQYFSSTMAGDLEDLCVPELCNCTVPTATDGEGC